MLILVADNPLATYTELYVLWQGPPPLTAEDLAQGVPLYLQAPHEALVGGPAPNEARGRLQRQVASLADRSGLEPADPVLGTEMVDRLEARPPRVLAVWTSATLLRAGRDRIYTEAAAAGAPIGVNLQGVALSWGLVEDYLRHPPFAARPVVAALIDYGSEPSLVWRLEGEPDGRVLRAPPAAGVYH